MREIAFHTLFCMVSMVSILLTMQKKYTSENDPLQQAQITMREFQFFESIIEKSIFFLLFGQLFLLSTYYYFFIKQILNQQNLHFSFKRIPLKIFLSLLF
jgi:hypothetical protein